MCAASQSQKILAIGVVVLGVFDCFGCIRNSPPLPMTNDSLDLLSRAAVLVAVVEQSHPRISVDIKNDPAGSQRKIFQCLLPVIRSKPADTSEPIDPDYIFYFQSGRNPITFEIRFCGDRLCYRANGFDHIGGSASKFKNIMHPLFNTNRCHKSELRRLRPHLSYVGCVKTHQTSLHLESRCIQTHPTRTAGNEWQQRYHRCLYSGTDDLRRTG